MTKSLINSKPDSHMKPYLARTIPAKMKEKSKDFRKKILTRKKQSDCQAINLPSLIESPH